MTDRVSVAVINSGVHVPHTHLPSVAGGVSINLQGKQHASYVDRRGHCRATAQPPGGGYRCRGAGHSICCVEALSACQRPPLLRPKTLPDAATRGRVEEHRDNH